MILDKDMAPSSRTGAEPYQLIIGTSAVSQTNKRTHSIKPGYRFQVVQIQVYALTVTATISVSVVLNNNIANTFTTAPITPVADTVVIPTLLSTTASLRGQATDSIDLIYTSNGTGAATNCIVSIWVRPFPMASEY